MLLEDVFAEQTDFDLRAERVDSALERLHRCVVAETGDAVVVATLHGMTISSPELQLTGTLRIAQPGALEDLPEELAPVGPSDEADHLVVLHTSEHEDPQAAGVSGGRALRDLLCALRLFGDGRVALGGLAWVRCMGGRWLPVSLPRGWTPARDARRDRGAGG